MTLPFTAISGVKGIFYCSHMPLNSGSISGRGLWLCTIWVKLPWEQVNLLIWQCLRFTLGCGVLKSSESPSLPALASSRLHTFLWGPSEVVWTMCYRNWWLPIELLLKYPALNEKEFLKVCCLMLSLSSRILKNDKNTTKCYYVQNWFLLCSFFHLCLSSLGNEDHTLLFSQCKCFLN